MKFSFALVCIIVVIIATTFSLANDGPTGCYRGSYMMGTIKGEANFGSTPNKFDLKIHAFDKDLECKNIQFSFDTASGKLIIPGAKDANTCIGKIIMNNHLKLDATVKKGEISLDVGLAKLDLDRCGAKKKGILGSLHL